jgi:hypothetical protein
MHGTYVEEVVRGKEKGTRRERKYNGRKKIRRTESER